MDSNKLREMGRAMSFENFSDLPPSYNNVVRSAFEQFVAHQPITTQPQENAWPGILMIVPSAQRGCPPGLEYLSALDQLVVQEEVKNGCLKEVLCLEMENKFTVTNNLGQKVYFAAEKSTFWDRQCSTSERPFDMTVLDKFGNEVIHMHRPLKCTSCFWFCCLQTIEVSSPPGTLIGTVEQQWNVFYPSFYLKNETGEVIIRIKGPLSTNSVCCNDVEFRVLSANGNEEIGRISKRWVGFAKASASADNFQITFPVNLDVKMKAVLLGACFLIDAMYYT